MQVVERVSGLVLLQSVEPVALHGVFAVILEGVDQGWVVASLSPPTPPFTFEVLAGRATLKMSLDVASRFASTVLVLCTIHVSELHEDRASDVGTLEVTGTPGRQVLHWTAPDTPAIKTSFEDEGMEVRMTPSLASSLAFRILRRLGEISINAGEGSTEP